MLVIHRILNKKLLLIRSKNLAHPIGSNLIRLLRDITGEKKSNDNNAKTGKGSLGLLADRR
jgi:hypothetical protein